MEHVRCGKRDALTTKNGTDFFWALHVSKWDVRHVKWDVRHLKWDVRHVKWGVRHVKRDVTHVKWEYITPTLYVSMKTCTHFFLMQLSWSSSCKMNSVLTYSPGKWLKPGKDRGHECDNNADGPFKCPSLISGDWWKRRRDRMKKKIFRRLIEKDIDCETLVSSRNVGASEVQNTSYLSQKNPQFFSNFSLFSKRCQAYRMRALTPPVHSDQIFTWKHASRLFYFDLIKDLQILQDEWYWNSFSINSRVEETYRSCSWVRLAGMAGMMRKKTCFSLRRTK